MRKQAFWSYIPISMVERKLLFGVSSSALILSPMCTRAPFTAGHLLKDLGTGCEVMQCCCLGPGQEIVVTVDAIVLSLQSLEYHCAAWSGVQA